MHLLTGTDGNSAGGQLAGRQHYAADGSTLLLCTLAPLQWQVCSGCTSGCVLYPFHIQSLTCLCLIFPSLFRFKHPSEGELCALAGKQIPKPNRRDRWEVGEGVRLSTNSHKGILSTGASFDIMLPIMWLGSFTGGRMGRSSLSLCPKTSIFTWKKLQSMSLMLLVKLYMQVESLVLTYNGSKITFSCFCSQCCVFSWSTSGW